MFYSTLVVVVFVFKQKTAYEMRISDWSSDVCSSDLKGRERRRIAAGRSAEAAAYTEHVRTSRAAPARSAERSSFSGLPKGPARAPRAPAPAYPAASARTPCPAGRCADWPRHPRRGRFAARPEERRVGKECVGTGRSRWSPDH